MTERAIENSPRPESGSSKAPNVGNAGVTTDVAVPVVRRRPGRSPQDGPKVESGSTESRRRAAVVLEVLAGVLMPAEAAETRGFSLGSYFHLERRALEGLVKACEPRPKGRRASSAEKEMERLRHEVKRVEQESARYQALARAARSAAGLSAEALSKAKSKTVAGKKRRWKPTVRALKVARTLKKETRPETGEFPSAPLAEGRV